VVCFSKMYYREVQDPELDPRVCYNSEIPTTVALMVKLQTSETSCSVMACRSGQISMRSIVWFIN
jgi:hypothetical protein